MAEINKIPCIECSISTWAYIKPYLKEWGYQEYYYFRTMSIENSVLFIDWNNAGYNFGPIDNVTTRRELITNVEEFLDRTAKLKGFTYKRKDVMKINGIEIKPGMGIYVNGINAENLYIVIPTKKGLGVIAYGLYSYWELIDPFLKENYNKIVRICDIPNSLIEGDVLWEKPIEIVLTMDEIAEKFGYPVEQIKIVKQ